MKAEALRSPTETPKSELDGMLHAAYKDVLKLTVEPGFTSYCRHEGVSVDPIKDYGTPKYWSAVAAYASEDVKLRSAPNHPVSQDLRTFELVSAVPALIHEDIASGSRHPRSEPPQGRRFDGLLQAYALDYPDTDVASLTTGLSRMANGTLDDLEAGSTVSRTLNRHIRKVQHRTAFGQILARTGLPYRSAVPSELSGGIDFVVGEAGRPLRVEVEPSIGDLALGGVSDNANASYLFRSDGTLAMHSHVLQNEFHNRFSISDNAAERKAGTVDELLTRAELHMHASQTA